ncbi:ABC transporter substrate-binding protein [Microbispora sp. NPDC046933]|uniref:ABC transporter substrate-binding protein n=1 Tax=Microbispora sp. NPDC046933 TaxID=3155618 RepID=UPI0033DA7443
MSKPPRRGFSAALAALAAVAVLVPLTACASESGSATAKTGADGLVPVTVLRSNGALFEPLFIAEQQGYFTQAGLAVTIKAGAQDTSQNAPLVINGQAQFAMTDSSGFLKGAAAGLPIRIVTGLMTATTKTEQTDGLLVKKDSKISSFADLQGKTVGLSALGGTIEFICRYLVQQDGGDPGEVKFVALPSTALVDAVSTGKTDAVFAFGPFYAGGKADDSLRVVGKGMNSLPGILQGLLFASQSYLAENADTAKKFGEAIAKAVTYANDHPDDVRAIDSKYTTLPASYIAAQQLPYFDTKINTAVMRTVITKMHEFGLLKSAPQDGDVYWDQAPTSASGS